jgi:hypothetical protein
VLRFEADTPGHLDALRAAMEAQVTECLAG